MDTALALYGNAFYLVVVCQRAKQRLRLLDLREFRRRRKAFESGCKNAVRIGVAAGRLIKLRQRVRCSEFEATPQLGDRSV